MLFETILGNPAAHTASQVLKTEDSENKANKDNLQMCFIYHTVENGQGGLGLGVRAMPLDYNEGGFGLIPSNKNK